MKSKKLLSGALPLKLSLAQRRKYGIRTNSIVATLQSIKILLKKAGWTRGRLYRENEGYCWLGALQAVDGRYEAAAEKLCATAVETYSGCIDIVTYNDNYAQSVDDVIEPLNDAIAAARRRARR